MTISITAFKEKIRRKELYIVSVVGVLILLLFGTGNGSLSIGGVPVTDYRILAPIMLMVVNAINCMLAVVMSLGTIPKEYERGTSHLVWIRKVPQWRYHGELALANVFAGLVSELILFIPLFIFMLINQRADELWRLLPAYLILGINVAAVSMVTSMFSIAIPKFAAGAVSSAITLMGIFHSLLSTLKDVVGGLGGELIKYALKLVPDLHDLQAQAGAVLRGGKPDVHVILAALLVLYVYTVLLLVLHKSGGSSGTAHVRRSAVPAILLTGAALIAGVTATGTYGLSGEDLAIYEGAVALEEGDCNIGFEGFALTDYPVAFYDGDWDYVVVRDKDGYSVEKRKAVVNSIVATAWPVEGHYEVLAPTMDKMSSFLGMMSMGNSDYGTVEQTATIWHEAFHCYQLTRYAENVEAICPFEIDEKLIAGEADTNTQAAALFERQAQLLEDAVKSDDIDRIQECIVKYRELDEERKRLLSEEVASLEDYYTRVEGTAFYVEACIYKMLVPGKLDSNYIDVISEYAKGSTKYYRTGMAQCMILDKLNPEWKKGFDFSEPVIQLIYRELEIF
ncbi:MAG: hypothetical protein K2O34_13335 [Acetatifactor sp.]|nr:hypothetical protein [Acetatifactor sp.]